MKKAVILGSPGSGKSTFGQKLHDVTGLPLVHLDFYYHQTKYNYYNDRPAWVSRVEKLMQAPRWIMDGNYRSTMPLRCRAADTIILFRLPKWLCLYRAIKRNIKYRNKTRADMPSEWKEKVDWQFLKYLWTFEKYQIPPILEEIRKYPNKEILVFNKYTEAEKYLEELRSKR